MHDDTARVLGELVNRANPSTRRVRASESKIMRALDMTRGELVAHLEDLADFGMIEFDSDSWGVSVTDAGFTERSRALTERNPGISGATTPYAPKSGPLARARARVEPPSPHYEDRAPRPADSVDSVGATRGADPSSKARSVRGDRAQSELQETKSAQPQVFSLGRIKRGTPDPARNAKTLTTWFRAECMTRARTPRLGDVNVGALSGQIANWRRQGASLEDIQQAMENFFASPWERSTVSAWKQLVSNINKFLPDPSTDRGSWDDEEDWE